MNKINKLKQFISNFFFGIRIAYISSKKYFAFKVILIILTVFIDLFKIWIWQEVLNGIINNSLSYKGLIIWIVIYIFLKICSYGSEYFTYYIDDQYSTLSNVYIENIMITKTARMDLSFFDSSKMGDKLRQIRADFGEINNLVNNIFNCLSSLIYMISALMMLLVFNVYFAIVAVILFIPYYIIEQQHRKKNYELTKNIVTQNREMEYYEDVFFDENNQFEIKVNDCGRYFLNKRKNIWHNIYKLKLKQDTNFNIKKILMDIILLTPEIIILIVGIFKRVIIGTLQYQLNLINTFKNYSEYFLKMVSTIMVGEEKLNNLRDFMNLDANIEKSGDLILDELPKIEFSNVSFKYPKGDNDILNNCSFTIQKGEKLGLIGLNGSGKSTIIKLLLRFYDPQEGTIKINDLDIKEYDIYSVRKVFGVLFQEYVTYCLPLREIIALSSFDDRNNDELLDKACIQSGAIKIIDQWENKYETILGRYYADDGKNLSGGQWQIISLARTYFQRSDFVVLDEPSAALDPIEENKIFKRLYDLSENKGSIIISHRLSNTVLADKIIVLEDGKIIETGSHKELIMLNGKYAQYFNLQASKYI